MKIDKSIKIKVDEGVYSPDQDSYLLLDLIEVEEEEKVLEIGVGSGFISLHCLKKEADVTAVDKSDKALKNTKRNAEINGLDLRIKKSDLFSDIDDKYDVIIFNPPYLPKHEGLEIDDRWDGGERGDEVTMEFLENVENYLEKHGRVYLCFSDMAPLDNIKSYISQNFDVINKKEQRFRFENLYTYELKLVTSN